jgi:hypothetical protein
LPVLPGSYKPSEIPPFEEAAVRAGNPRAFHTASCKVRRSVAARQSVAKLSGEKLLPNMSFIGDRRHRMLDHGQAEISMNASIDALKRTKSAPDAHRRRSVLVSRRERKKQATSPDR